MRYLCSGQGPQRHCRGGGGGACGMRCEHRRHQPDHPKRHLLDTEKADFDTVQDKLKAVGENLGVQIIIQREDVFQYMYKI